jgi:hypothetical protein
MRRRIIVDIQDTPTIPGSPFNYGNVPVPGCHHYCLAGKEIEFQEG